MLKCALCDTYVRDTNDARARDWLPGYFDNATDGEVSAPVCRWCVMHRLTYNPSFGDYELPASPEPDAVVSAS